MAWLSLQFYPAETQDVFLIRALKPFLQQFIWTKPAAKAFFIRYQDEKGPHIRVRFEGETAWLEEVIRPAFEGWFRERGEWEETVYLPETVRYGGSDGLALAEAYFHHSTRAVLERMGRDQFMYGDAMFDTLRLHLITAFCAGMTRDRARWYFDQLGRQWMGLFFSPSNEQEENEITASFATLFAPQKDQLSAVLDSFWRSLEKEDFDPKQPEWERWYRDNQLILKALGDNMEKVLPSLLHLTSNRIGINNQDEVYLNYILSKAL